jgi:hypothetical protein
MGATAREESGRWNRRFGTAVYDEATFAFKFS